MRPLGQNYCMTLFVSMYFNKVKFGNFCELFSTGYCWATGSEGVIYQALKGLSKFCICENACAYKEPYREPVSSTLVMFIELQYAKKVMFLTYHPVGQWEFWGEFKITEVLL